MPASPEAALSLLLQGLGGRTLAVQRTELPRPVLTPTHLLLPALDAAQQRAAVAHAAAHLLYSPAAQPAQDLKPLAQAVIAALEDARVEQLLLQALPGVRQWFLPPLRAAVQPHGLSCAALLSRLGLALMDEAYADGNHWVHKARTLFAAARAQHGLHDYAALRRIASVLANDLGQMRVRYEPQQQSVAAAYRDDNSYLWQHAASADQATELQAPAPPLPGAGDAPPAQAPPPDASEPVWHYPEWDYRLQQERAHWCTLREPPLPAAPAASPAAADVGTVLALPRARRLDRAQRLRRQWEGEELDLDAAIDVHIAQRLRLAPEARVFRRTGRSAPGASVLVLLDLSASTLDRAAGGALSLLELERQAALLLARSARAGGDRLAVHGFSSDTRERVRYLRLLDFDAPLDTAAQARIAGVPAAGSTRMGAALRHATALLGREAAPLRAIVLVSDGAPSDVDVFDARYLVADAQAAVQQARRAGIATHALAVDPGADAYVRRIFGWRHYRIVDAPQRLPAQLGALYARLAAP